jgi:hypothetical protein
LINNLLAARRAGTDMRVALEEALHRESRSDNQISGLLMFAFTMATLLLFASIAGLLIEAEQLKRIPGLSIFSGLSDEHLKILAGVLGTLSFSLLAAWMKHRQEQKKHAFVLFLVAEGQVRDAALLLFGGKQGKGGKLGSVIDALGTVVSAAT